MKLGLLMLLIGLFTLSFPFQRTLSADRKPNIILILADDLGYGDLSSYGAPDMNTPNMDHIVESGMKFTRFRSSSPVCAPTRAAVLTGQYPDRVGVPGLIRPNALNTWGYLSPDAPLISSLLHRAAYHTAAIGKWNLGFDAPNVPQERGFDYSYVHLADNVGDYYTHRRAGINYMRENGEKIDPEGHATNLFGGALVDYVRRRASTDAPFFAYYAPSVPHFPIQPPEERLKTVKQREGDITNKRAKLVALIEHLDHWIGRLIEALRETNQYSNTLILFTSDNGGDGNKGARVGPFRGQKGNMYEGGLRVPMAALWPGKIEPNTRTDLPATTMDLYPTITEAAGVHVDHRIDGTSFLPTLLGNEQPEFLHRTVFFVRREGGGWNDWAGRSVHAVLEGDWKLLQNHPSEPFELYNLAEDPKEQENLIEERNDVFRRLERKLRRHIRQAGRVPFNK